LPPANLILTLKGLLQALQVHANCYNFAGFRNERASLIFFLVIVGGLFISIFANFYTGYKKPLKEVHNSIVKDDYVFSYLDLIDYLKNDNENITIVDLRSEEKYKNGHIESAINIPLI